MTQLVGALPAALAGEDREAWSRALATHQAAGVPRALAGFMAATEALGSAFDIAELAASRRIRIDVAAAAYFQCGARLGLDWLRGEIERLAVEGPWQAMARGGLRDAALQVQRGITDQVLGAPGSGPVAARLDRWLERHAQALAAWQRTLTDMRAAGSADFATLSVGVDAVRKLVD
jgi:glutamate dehydrogenase